jgi:hypothetical protein
MRRSLRGDGARAAAPRAGSAGDAIVVEPQPLHDLSPWLYMQMMEPLGTTDGSVEASWDHLQQRWRPDRSQVERHKFKLALIESHFTMQGRNRCDLNSAWATGVAYARFLNLHQRHGDPQKSPISATSAGRAGRRM